MNEQLVTEQIEELRSRQNIESINEIKQNIFKVVYSPQLTNSPYAHLTYNLKVALPDRYPQVPPYINFIDKIYHLNIDPVSGIVNMPVLGQDWSPFITLSAIFESLDNLLEEPDIHYPASQALKHQYMNDFQKYHKKIEQMVHISDSAVRGDFQQSIVEHVEEIANPKGFSNILGNNTFDEIKIDDDSVSVRNIDSSVEPPKNQFLSPLSPISPIIEKSAEANFASSEKEFAEKIQKDSNLNVQDQKNNNKLIKSRRDVTSKIQKCQKIEIKNKNQKGKRLKQQKQKYSNEKHYQSTQSMLLLDHGQKFEQIQISLKKSGQLLQMFMHECQTMENIIKSTQNARIRQLIEKKLQKQWEMVEQILEISTQLNQKLFTTLKSDTKHLLK